jgi:hypothetical protein
MTTVDCVLCKQKLSVRVIENVIVGDIVFWKLAEDREGDGIWCVENNCNGIHIPTRQSTKESLDTLIQLCQ